ncbi:MAG: glycosyltransferase [bacterium]|nr:glycosyltransferase [bacterium]
MPEKCGIAIYSDNLIRELRKKADVVTIGNENSEADYVTDFKSRSFGDALRKIIEKEKIDVLNIQHNAAFFHKFFNFNLLSALKQEIPVTVTLHEVHYEKKCLRDRVLSLIERLIAKKSLAIVHTPRQQEFMRRKYNAKTFCIFHGLEVYPAHKRKGKNLLFFGIISEKKGLQFLLNAMKDLKECKLTVSGSFTDRKIESKIKGKKQLPNVKANFGWVSEKDRQRCYKNADLVVLPYTWAPFQSGILHNAISYGLPVVVTKTGSLWEMVEAFELGEIVRAGDSKALAEGVRKVFSNYNSYKKGIDTYRKEASWKATAEKHLKLFKRL